MIQISTLHSQFADFPLKFCTHLHLAEDLTVLACKDGRCRVSTSILYSEQPMVGLLRSRLRGTLPGGVRNSGRGRLNRILMLKRKAGKGETAKRRRPHSRAFSANLRRFDQSTHAIASRKAGAIWKLGCTFVLAPLLCNLKSRKAGLD